MKIEYIKIDEIKPYKNNPRKNKNAVAAVIASIREFGFRVPLVLDTEKNIINGHTRFKAAEQLEMKEVPCIFASDLSPEQVRAFRLVDNKTGELSSWDFEKMWEEIAGIKAGIDLEQFGFELSDDEIKNDLTDDFLSGEINLEEYNDEEFEYTCSCCGFKWGKK